MTSLSIAALTAIQSTAGAVPLKNEKGEVTMQKVKVKRYIAGKRPDYARDSSDEEDEDEDVFHEQVATHMDQDQDQVAQELQKAAREDRRLKRLQERERDAEADDEMEERHHRRVHEPEIVTMADEEMEEEDEMESRRRTVIDMEESEEEEEEEDEEEELDDEEIERRRKLMRERAKQREGQTDLLDVEEEKKSEDEEEEDSSEYEEYTDSEEETGPRLKPVFVRRSDRVTIQEREQTIMDETQEEEKKKRALEDRRKQSRKLVDEIIRHELQEVQGVDKEEDVVVTDDENDEEAYEAWKARELKRLKRDREERETKIREQQEIERLHNMTEEERRSELRNNPKTVTNKATKGKYKFLQKYYHRGAFFMNEEDSVYRRDFATPTLEDHFDKTILPKVMQVKNFGRSGRTKYTHLVDQDTTEMESPWSQDNALNMKFHTLHSAGSKQVFDRPSKKRKA